jgi:hypothetical protein
MNSPDPKELCLALVKADTQDEVVDLLAAAGYWEMQPYWREFGDKENNYSTIGNQQSKPDAALVEKLVNSVDARLMNECLTRGIDPKGTKAPQDIRDAIAQFFDNTTTAKSAFAGLVKMWSPDRRTKVAEDIVLVTTGKGAKEGNPCFSIIDRGEGQTPDTFPSTFMSIGESNKMRIPFVQGKFNMGGTGVLKFCGKRRLQLIVSRRNPAIVGDKPADPSDLEWGITVVRRVDKGEGRRSSVYEYLAPVGVGKQCLPYQGKVLRFAADTLPLFPDGREAYTKPTAWGTLVKLYEYDAQGFRSTFWSKGGLLSRMDLLLPDSALPIRIYECRKGYKGVAGGSFEVTLSGLGVRLEDDKNKNLEPGFPSSAVVEVAGQKMDATIYAFKKGKADTYRNSEGIIFTINGQTHGHLLTGFFRQKSVGHSYLADSILVMVDCGRLSILSIEDLFMNSRDRLSGGELRRELEDELEDVLKHHPGLRDLRARRQEEDTAEKVQDNKPLEDILRSLIQKSPTLANLFLFGPRASNPFKPVTVKSEEKPFVGRRHPTLFKLKGKDYGAELTRETAQNQRSRILFETDASNDYFSRSTEQGELELFLVTAAGRAQSPAAHTMNLHNGIGTLSVRLPEDSPVGGEFTFVAVVTDPTQVTPFENTFKIKVKPPAEPSGGSGTRKKPPAKEPGNDRETPSGITLPEIRRVYEPQWNDYTPHFDKFTALRIRDTGSDDSPDAKATYVFYVNMDNLYLKTEMKHAGTESEAIRNRFVNGNVLFGLALLHQDDLDQKLKKNLTEREEEEEKDEGEEMNIEDKIEHVTTALAPVLLPMIESLGGTAIQELASFDASVEAT